MTKAIKTKWTNVLKSGGKATAIVYDAVEHVIQHGDTSLLSHMIQACDNADMPAYSKRLRSVVRHAFPASKLRKNKKDGRYSITRGDETDQPFINTLRVAASEEISFIGQKMGAVLGEVKVKRTPQEELEARVKAQAKWITKQEGVSLEAYIQMLRDEYNAQAALAAVA